jgi:hypothetical protein
MQEFSPNVSRYIAEDMSIYIRYKEHQINRGDSIESNFNLDLFHRSKDIWIFDLSEAVKAFTVGTNNQHIFDCMERVDEIEEEVLSLTNGFEDK